MNHKLWSAVLMVGLLSGCQALGRTPQARPPAETAPAEGRERNEAVITATPSRSENCPALNEALPLQSSTYHRIVGGLNFRPHTMAATEDTITLENSLYQFVFCRSDRTWSVLPGEGNEEDYDVYSQARSQQALDPDYETVELEGTAYEARVRLDSPSRRAELEAPPNQETPTVDRSQDKVVFELIKPGATEPIVQTLYAAADRVDDPSHFFHLGVPSISQSVAYQGALWWAIEYEEGEGAIGVGTVIQYQPESDQITVWQPEELQDVQFIDMVITGEDTPTLWLGTNRSGEATPYVPAKGLVAYQPETGSVQTYSIHNSPLVGAIPKTLLILDDTLWIGTGNGACEVQLQTIDAAESWNCWRFVAMTDLPGEGVPLYENTSIESAATTLTQDTTEVLWATDSRYEVRYPTGFEITLAEGAERYPEDAPRYPFTVPPRFVWPGTSWHWNGERFVRPLDTGMIETHYFPRCITSDISGRSIGECEAMRGDLELLDLSAAETHIRYFSGWVDADAIAPYVTVVTADTPPRTQPNPLEAVKQSLDAVEQ
ncbi:MAG: hypothetical protein F6J95_008895 [Leptolyngbya sp. SIO1E4]|nr:hypothetical protein [Leptolyngbya sp. SIO1E4]